MPKYTLYILAAVSILFVSSCSKDDSKLALTQSLQELVAAVEQKQQLTVTAKLTRNFRGNVHFDQQTMSALIFRYYLTHKFIKIYTLINSIEIKAVETNNSQAAMVFHAALTSTKSTLPEHMRVFKIDSRWVRVDKDWKMTEANWVEVRPQTIYPQIKKLIVGLEGSGKNE